MASPSGRRRCRRRTSLAPHWTRPHTPFCPGWSRPPSVLQVSGGGVPPLQAVRHRQRGFGLGGEAALCRFPRVGLWEVPAPHADMQMTPSSFKGEFWLVESGRDHTAGRGGGGGVWGSGRVRASGIGFPIPDLPPGPEVRGLPPDGERGRGCERERGFPQSVPRAPWHRGRRSWRPRGH